MEKKKKTILIGACAVSIVATIVLLALEWTTTMHKMNTSEQTEFIYIDGDDDLDSVRVKSKLAWRFDWLSKMMTYRVRTGRYSILPGENSLALFRKLRNGQQEPCNLTIPNVRTMEQMAAYLGNHLMMDSIQFAEAFMDSSYISRYGYTKETLPALFIPNTYEVYWDVSMDGFMKRMERENKSFWNKEREEKAKRTGCSHIEIATLASIVDEETANNAEKPMVAGMYINRLHRGMLLQADPTVKFALGDFSLRRIYFDHLTVDNPYNTYRYAGLPPGPIRTASIVGIDAVLNYVEHPYLYMCAKEDFSGTHNFAATYSEHIKNAKRYSQALNKRGVR